MAGEMVTAYPMSGRDFMKFRRDSKADGHCPMAAGSKRTAFNQRLGIRRFSVDWRRLSFDGVLKNIKPWRTGPEGTGIGMQGVMG